ncbi:zinc-binding protein A33-like [Carcharodon carcharias]|uniref:zinc-binding protein A33-like n=1 Tax=Carcharodon carcharias TaxID=13397 RepID=UPI001B7D92B1|nr:zinc-binding protein A33-like [Carcharodon carcharias]
MAASKHFLTLAEDLTCSICLALFVEPVRLDCDHNFCKSCIQKCWGKQSQAVSCPECQVVFPQRSFSSNRVLANLVEKVRQLKVEESLSPCEEHGKRLNEDTEREQSHCEEHGEKLMLFCEEEEILICAECVDSPAHSDHRFLPIQKAVRTYKDQLKSSLDSMENEKKDISELKQQQARKISELEEFTGSLEQDISAQFAKIHQYLEEKEKDLIKELRRQKEEDLRPMEENLKRIEEELTSLEEKILNLCVDIEQQDDIPFLKELKRLGESYGLKTRKWDMLRMFGVKQTARKSKIQMKTALELQRSKYTGFQGPLLYTVWKKMKQIISPVPVSLTLDPNTAHCKLVLSDDWTSVRFSNKVLQVPDNPERFDLVECVLGSQAFSSGKHYWEVEVGDKTVWALGVVTRSASRKGRITVDPKYGYWLLQRNRDEYKAFENPSVILTPSVNPRTVRVYLDYEGGQLTFYNADDMSNLHTFTDTFTEKLFPFFYPGIQEEGKDAAPLKLCHFEP